VVRMLWLQCKTWASAVLAGLLYSLLGMLPKVFEELEVKQSVVVHHDETMA